MTERTLDLTPINTTVGDAARELLEDRAVGVVLEPGDATRYALLIAPCWADRFHPLANGGVGDGSNYLLVSTNFGLMYPIVRNADPGYVGGKLTPPGTAWAPHMGEVVGGFLDALWRELDDRSG